MYVEIGYYFSSYLFVPPFKLEFRLIQTVLSVSNQPSLAQVASIILGIVALFLMQDLKRRAMLSKMLTDGKTKTEAVVVDDVDEEDEFEEEIIDEEVIDDEIPVEEEVIEDEPDELIDVDGSDDEFDTKASE